MGELNSNGYVVQSLSEHKAALQNIFRQAFTSAIDLSEQSPQGMLINSMAELCANQDLVGLDIFNSLNLDNATGVVLSFLAVIRGTQRNDGTEAVATCLFTSSSYPYTIPAGTTFKVLNTEFVFTNETAINITSASQSAQLTCTTIGLTELSSGYSLQSETYIPQLTDIEITSITDGVDAESDDELRARLKSTSSVIGNDIDAIYTALLDLDNVSKANVFENDTSGVDIYGRPAHSIEAIVLGDTDQNVVNVIAGKAAGTVTYGNTSGIYTDSQDFTHTIYFTRPTKKRVYIRSTITAKEYEVIDSSYYDTIRSECNSYVEALKCGQNVSYTSIFGTFAKHEAFDISSLELSLDASTWVSTNLSIGVREYASIDNPSGDITFTTS